MANQREYIYVYDTPGRFRYMVQFYDEGVIENASVSPYSYSRVYKLRGILRLYPEVSSIGGIYIQTEDNLYENPPWYDAVSHYSMNSNFYYISDIVVDETAYYSHTIERNGELIDIYIYHIICPLSLYRWIPSCTGSSTYYYVTSYTPYPTQSWTYKLNSFTGSYSPCFSTSATKVFAYACNGWSGSSMIDGIIPSANAIDLSNMYSGSAITKVNFSGWNTATVTNMSGLFSGCVNLGTSDVVDADLSGLDTKNVTDMSNMFSGCQYLYSIKMDSNNVKNVITMSRMFNACFRLSNLDISNWETNNLTDMSEMFKSAGSNFRSLGSDLIVDISHFNTSSVLTMKEVFSGLVCKQLIFAGIDTSRVQEMDNMFYNIAVEEINGSTDTIDASWLNTSSVSNASYMFYSIHRFSPVGVSSNFKIDVSGFDISKVTNMTSMFGSNASLTTIYSDSDWTTSATSTDMFTGDTSLVGGISYASSKVNATYAKRSGGYFTAPAQRTITLSGAGTGGSLLQNGVSENGSYDFGAAVIISADPNDTHYMSQLTVTDVSGTKNLVTSDTLNTLNYSISLKHNTTVAVTFPEREYHTVTVTQDGTAYTIQGAGRYLYLDKPTLIADLNEGYISFYGWFNEGSETPESKSNPYTFLMPNEDISFIAKFGDTPFTDEKVRQFVLRNGMGELYQLTNKNSNLFLSGPNGLGYSKEVSMVRYGNSASVIDERFDLPKPKGAIYFHSESLEDIYLDFNEFVKFSVKKPVVLWYKIPLSESALQTIPDIYHIPVEITNVEKTEAEENGSLISSVEFQGTGFWRHSQSSSETTSASFSIFNNGNLDSGIEITFSKSDGSPFTNPILTFSNELNEYGVFALEGTFTKVHLNTKDKEQNIDLWNGFEEIENPFSYLNFNVADGVRVFPYPKLKNGVSTTITLSYDGIGDEAMNFVVIFDEEYVSV